MESIAIGARTHVPQEILLPLLNSIAEYMDEEREGIVHLPHLPHRELTPPYSSLSFFLPATRGVLHNREAIQPNRFAVLG